MFLHNHILSLISSKQEFGSSFKLCVFGFVCVFMCWCVHGTVSVFVLRQIGANLWNDLTRDRERWLMPRPIPRHLSFQRKGSQYESISVFLYVQLIDLRYTHTFTLTDSLRPSACVQICIHVHQTSPEFLPISKFDKNHQTIWYMTNQKYKNPPTHSDRLSVHTLPKYTFQHHSADRCVCNPNSTAAWSVNSTMWPLVWEKYHPWLFALYLWGDERQQ